MVTQANQPIDMISLSISPLYLSIYEFAECVIEICIDVETNCTSNNNYEVNVDAQCRIKLYSLGVINLIYICSSSFLRTPRDFMPCSIL